MEHRGEIVQKAVRESGFSVTKLAKKLHHSRRWMYHVFENPDVGIDLIAEIGKIIQHDFSDEIRDFRRYAPRELLLVNEPGLEYLNYKKELDQLKAKYVRLLEQYNALLAAQSKPSATKAQIPKKKKK